jgi:thermitase
MLRKAGRIIEANAIRSLLALPVFYFTGVGLTGWAQANVSWGFGSSFGVEAEKAQSLVGNICATSKIAIAVIDTGVDVTHPDLKNSIWNNEKEVNGKAGVDDDKNGYVDDLHGWDFVTRSGKIIDTHGHGTHVSGIAAAKGPLKDSYLGICPGARIMSLRYYSERSSGAENLRNTILAIEYAVNNGARIINYSGGGAQFSQPEFKAFQEAERKGVFVSAAAGNERSNADEKLYFPAAYPLTNILSVAAINQSGQVPAFSNWGQSKVHVMAPGASILSTVPGGGYGYMSGTSQATAFVSGLAAMLLSVNPKLDFLKLKDFIENSARKMPQLVGKARSGGLVDAVAALKLIGIKPATTLTPPSRSLALGEAKLDSTVETERRYAANPVILPKKEEGRTKRRRAVLRSNVR